MSPGWCGSVDWESDCEVKGHWFDAQSGHMPGLWARSPVMGVWEAATQWCFSPSLSPSLLFCLEINKIFKKKNLFLRPQSKTYFLRYPMSLWKKQLCWGTINYTYKECVICQVLTFVYTCEAITIIEIVNISLTPKVSSCFSNLSLPKQPWICFLSLLISLHFLEIYIPGIIRHALYSSDFSFTQHNYF